VFYLGRPRKPITKKHLEEEYEKQKTYREEYMSSPDNRKKVYAYNSEYKKSDKYKEYAKRYRERMRKKYPQIK